MSESKSALPEAEEVGRKHYLAQIRHAAYLALDALIERSVAAHQESPTTVTDLERELAGDWPLKNAIGAEILTRAKS